LLTHSSFACNQEYSIENGILQDPEPALEEGSNQRIVETEQTQPPAFKVADHPVSKAKTSAADSANSPLASKNSIQGSNATNAEEVTVTNITEKGDGGPPLANDVPCEAKTTATKEPQSVYELELKLFKNLALRLVPKAAPLMPMLQRVGEASEDGAGCRHAPEMPPEAEKYHRNLDARDERATTAPNWSFDDLAVVFGPTRHVDYLGHNWNEDDLVLSWRYLTKNRQDVQNSTRLENAAWRVWAQQTSNLGIVSPKSLNWLKECDVVWLYGPLVPAPWHRGHLKTENYTFGPFQKRRRSEKSLLQRAAALLKVKEEASVHKQPGESFSDPTSSSSSIVVSTIGTPPYHQRYYSQRTTSPDTKHVSFEDDVQQAQAIDIEDEEWDLDQLAREDEDKDTISRPLDQGNLRTITNLPRTTLRVPHGEESPRPSAWPSHGRLSATEDAETLRGPLHNFLLDNDDGAIADEACWHSWRRAEDGMFHEYDEDLGPKGFVGLFANAVNTAKDMGYLLWRKQGQNGTAKHASS
jgi:hypothetical protein